MATSDAEPDDLAGEIQRRLEADPPTMVQSRTQYYAQLAAQVAEEHFRRREPPPLG